MTPTPFTLLLVALFWTLPASAVALVQSRNGRSLEDVMASVKGTFGLPQAELQPQPDA